MDVSYLAELLRAERFGECKEAAGAMLRREGLSTMDKAHAFLALSRSLAALHAYQESLAPAELAVYFAREGAQYDLLGRALCHLAGVCQENRLYKRATGCLEEYFHYFTLYERARALEGWLFHVAAGCYQAMGRGAKALEYYEKAYRWHRGAEPQQWDQHRAALTWQCLRQGRLELAAELLAESEGYLKTAPNDLDARARHLANLAYQAFMLGAYESAVETAVRLMNMRGLTPLRKTQACLTLHQTAKAMGMPREALGMGVLARIQATVARRPDLEEEIVRSMLQVQQREGLPLMEELFRVLCLAGAGHHTKQASS